MVTNQKVTGKASSMPGGLACGAVVSLIITLIGSMAAAYLVSGERIPESGIGYCSMVILLLSSALGAATAAHKIKHRLLYVCVMSGVIYYGLLLAMTALFFGGQYQGMGVTALMVLAGVGTVILMQSRHRKTRTRRMSRRRTP